MSGIYASHRVSVAKAFFRRNFAELFGKEKRSNLEVINFNMNKTIRRREKVTKRKMYA